jgi:hypothetical protein
MLQLAMIVSIFGVAAKKLPSEIGGFGVLHYCVGFRRSPIRLRHRTLFPCIVPGLHHGIGASMMQTTPIVPVSLLSFSVQATVFPVYKPMLAIGWGGRSPIFCNSTHSSKA